MLPSDVRPWIEYAKNDIDVAIREVDASHAVRGINSAKRVFDFVSEKMGMGKL